MISMIKGNSQLTTANSPLSAHNSPLNPVGMTFQIEYGSCII